MSIMYGNPTGSVRMGAPMTYAAPPPMTYAAPPTMTYAAPPQQQQLAVMEQPQMVYAAAPQQQMVYASAPQQQLAVRTNPNNLFQGGNIVSEGPVARQQLIQEGRLFEGEMERPPVIIPGQMIDIQQLMLQQPQMMQEVIMEPQAVMGAPPMTYAQAPMTYAQAPMTYAQVPAVTVLEEQVQFAAAPQQQMVIQEPLANGYGQPTVQYAAMPAGSVMVEEMLMAQPLQEQGVVYAQPEVPGFAVQEQGLVYAQPMMQEQGVVYAQPMMQQPVAEYVGPEMFAMPMAKTGTMVAVPPEQAYMVAARPQGSVVSGRKGTITNALFDMLDVNADGKISKSEFRRGLKGEIIQVGQVANIPMRR